MTVARYRRTAGAVSTLHYHLVRRLPSPWSRASFVGSAGTVSAAAIRRSIEQQKGV